MDRQSEKCITGMDRERERWLDGLTERKKRMDRGTDESMDGEKDPQTANARL